MNHEIETNYNTGELMPMSEAPKTLMQKGVEKLRQHAELKQMAFEYADFITKTGACPAIYKGKPMDAAAAIIRGTALGFDPDGALESFFVISGKTGMYARAMIAVAENVGCRVWEEEATSDAVTWAGTRPGDDKVERVTWDTARVKAANYDKNSKYKTNSIEMMRAKCQAELARIIAPGALMGLVSEVEKDEVAATVRQQSQRLDKPTGGVAALKARAKEPQQEPQQEIEQAPAVDEVEQQLLDAIAQVPTAEELGAIADEVKEAYQDGLITDEAHQRIMAAGKARQEQLS